jgi:hypothetical protein
MSLYQTSLNGFNHVFLVTAPFKIGAFVVACISVNMVDVAPIPFNERTRYEPMHIDVL